LPREPSDDHRHVPSVCASNLITEKRTRQRIINRSTAIQGNLNSLNGIVTKAIQGNMNSLNDNVTTAIQGNVNSLNDNVTTAIQGNVNSLNGNVTT